MDKAFIKDEARFYFVPLLLGNNQVSRALAKSIFKKYHVKSFILDEKKSFSDVFSLSSEFLTLYETDDELTVFQLLELAKELPSSAAMPILIPCSEKYSRFLSDYGDALEADFIISSEELALTSSPLKIISE